MSNKEWSSLMCVDENDETVATDKTVTVWTYFEKGKNSENAKCLLCSAVLKLSQRSRKG
jgi:hypothetical protein